MSDDMTVKQAVELITGALLRRIDEHENTKLELEAAKKRCAAWSEHDKKNMEIIKQKTNEVWDREDTIRKQNIEIEALKTELAQRKEEATKYASWHRWAEDRFDAVTDSREELMSAIQKAIEANKAALFRKMC